MRKIVVALVCGLASTAMAQVGGEYLGPGILSPGAGNIGMRSGQQVDLRFFADAEGVYDNGLIPFATNSQGQLVTINGLYGETVNAGVYGQHVWRQTLLGLDASGGFYHYDNASQYDGSTANVRLGLTHQPSRRLIFALNATGGTTSIGAGTPQYDASGASAVVGQQSALLFDNRIYYLQGGGAMTYLLSPRTSVQIGGDGFASRYQASGLIGVNGYDARASILHRLSRTRTIGFTYQRMHYSFVRAYGQSDINIGQLIFATSLGRTWTFALNGGIAQASVQSVQQISLNPVIAALLGQSFGLQTFATTNYNPNGSAVLTGKLKNSSITFSYAKTILPGNGVYLTSRSDNAYASYSYTGIRNWNFAASGGYYRLNTLGQALQSYNSYDAGVGLTYTLTRSLHLTGRYDYRYQDIAFAGFRHDASRVSAGIAWSPGDVPLSLW